jgi:hypothetical protein
MAQSLPIVLAILSHSALGLQTSDYAFNQKQ